jgi:hypothetical protein
MTQYQVQVYGEWGDKPAGHSFTNYNRWRPAITGKLNTTGKSDEWASTFEKREDAQATLDGILRYECVSTTTAKSVMKAKTNKPDTRECAPKFRVTEVDQ